MEIMDMNSGSPQMDESLLAYLHFDTIRKLSEAMS